MSLETIMRRVERCGKSFKQMDAGLVWMLAAEVGLSLTGWPDGRLLVRGPKQALAALAPALRHHKAALLRGQCRDCPSLAETSRGLCLWCATLPPRVYTYEPGSRAERLFLGRLEASQRPNDQALRRAA